jgi:thiol-disulfide isomerase/thioredoxin
VRTSVGVTLVAVCLGLAGCSLFGKKNSAPSGGSKPFLGSSPTPAPGPHETAGADPAPAPATGGLLAGQVVDNSNHRPAKVFIQVVDLEESGTPAKAPLGVEGQQDGYFVVQGLKNGRHYRLIAWAKEGDRVLSGATVTTPPNPRVSIYLSEERAAADSPIPGPPAAPGTRPLPGEKAEGAALDPPVKVRPGETPAKSDNPAPTNPASWAPAAGTPPMAPDRIGQGKIEGFTTVPSPKVDIPHDTSPALPPPPWAGGGGTPSVPAVPVPGAPPADGPPSPGAHLPAVATPVPSCVVVGRRVDNFALYDLNGDPWELRRNRRGKLVLLDFWYSSCVYCLRAMPHLVDLQERYGQYGLEVVGIAYETGPQSEQVARVRGVRGRYHIKHPTLLGGGGSCPVKTQLQVTAFPTVILLDEQGEIVWSSGTNGIADPDTQRDLETEIRRRLLGNR